MTCFLGLEYLILTYDYFRFHKNIIFWPKIGWKIARWKRTGFKCILNVTVDLCYVMALWPTESLSLLSKDFKLHNSKDSFM